MDNIDKNKYLEIYKELKTKMENDKFKNDRISNLLNNLGYKNDELNALNILNMMNKNQVINYQSILEKLIKKWNSLTTKPKIVLHSCCAPCSTYTLEFLCKYADVTIFFSNSNIHPKKEYIKRSEVQKKFIEDFNEKTNNNVKYYEDEYKPAIFFKKVQGLESEPEGGQRCDVCFQMRLENVAKFAKDNNYDYFGSALTISPKKPAKLINELGFEIQEIYDVKYLPSDFKKNKGYQRSIEMCNEYNVYRQCYCGCIFALNDQLKRNENKEG